ncbi:phosphoglycerate mutase-like protein [Martensiomyces pterosporus]|nr:phosphoglycerate mutase-like protein [Martensiomyces pterosporus]
MRISLVSALALSPLAAAAAQDSSSSKFYCEAPRPSAATYKAIPGYTLAHLQVVHRHGDRVPENYSPVHPVMDMCGKYPDLVTQRHSHGAPVARYSIEISDDLPYADRFWKGNCEVGQLTDLGSESMARLGQAIRSIYIDRLGFMSQESWPQEIYWRADYYWRTMQSGRAVLVGLGDDKAHPEVTMHVRPQSMETYINNGSNCPQLAKAFTAAYTQKDYFAYAAQIAGFQNRTLNIYQEASSPTWKMMMNTVNDYLWLSVCHDKPFACSSTNATDCLSAQDAFTAYEIVSKQSQIIQAYPAVPRLFAGPFLGELRKSIAAALAPTSESSTCRPKFELHSAHDATIYYLLSLLKKDDMSKWPVYASNLIFETWKNNQNNTYVVRLIYNGDVVTASKDSGIDWSAVPLEAFYKLFDANTPDLATECQ